MAVQTFSSGKVLNIHPSSGTGAIQKVLLSGPPTAGTFTLSYGGQTTAVIAYNATAAQVETALTALSSIGLGNVLVTGGPGGGTAAWFVNFRGTLDSQPITLMTIDSTGLTGGTGAVTTQLAGHARKNDTDYPITNITWNNTGRGGWHQNIIVSPTWLRWTSQTYSIPGMRNPAPQYGQLWPRGNTTMSWPY